MKLAKLHAGNAPENGSQLARFGDWHLFDLSREPGEWMSLKLVYLGAGGMPKANFRLGWNGQRLAATRDSGLLSEKHPGLYADLMAWLVSNLSSALKPPPSHTDGLSTGGSR